MITLITGAPGAGKTAALVDMLRELVRERPLYVHGLDGLTLDHQPVDGTKWHEMLPDGAVLVVDEAQQIWRPRGPSVKPGPDIQALEVHRHRGIDIFLTTQKPNLVDANVRGLVGRHIHLRDTGWLGRWWYEWPECSETLAWKTCPIKRRYKLPRKAFELYKSATVHTKGRRIGSPMLWITALLVVAFAVLAAMVYRTISSKFDPPAAKPEAKPAAMQAKGGAGAAGAPWYGSGLTGAQIVAARIPRLAAEPETAPAYDHLRQVVAKPRVIGGYCAGANCRCFTNQGTDPGLTNEACRAWIASPPFDPYREQENAQEARNRAQEAREPRRQGQGAVEGGKGLGELLAGGV